MSSGRASSTSCQWTSADGRCLRPNKSWPPAISTTSGPQCPEQKGGTPPPIRKQLYAALDELNTREQVCDQFLRALRHFAHFPDASNIIEDVREACWLEIHYLWRTWQSLGEPRNRAITHRADVAQFLGENYVRV